MFWEYIVDLHSNCVPPIQKDNYCDYTSVKKNARTNKTQATHICSSCLGKKTKKKLDICYNISLDSNCVNPSA